MHSPAAIEVDDLYREYMTRDKFPSRKQRVNVALDHVSLAVRPGELFAIVGPNGAGKTTLTKVLSTILLPNSGQATVLGYDVILQADIIRPLIGLVLGGERGLYLRLSGRDNLRYFAALYNIPAKVGNQRIEKLLDAFGLVERANDRVENYSRGMKQRLHLARGLINNPKLLLLDEPTIGLDPDAAYSMRRTIRSLADQGTTILMTSHYLFEVDDLCDRIGVIDKGKFHYIGTPKEFKSQLSDRKFVHIDVEHTHSFDLEAFKQVPGVQSVETSNTGTIVTLKIETVSPMALLSMLTSLLPSGEVRNVTVREPTLEETYLEFLGRRTDE